jgi:class 3 adenylate cyclase
VIVEDQLEVRYAEHEGARIAFSVRGTGPQVVVVESWLSNQDLESLAGVGSWLDRLASFATVVSYDQRGSGLSDPVALDHLPTLEEWTDDLDAVIEAAAIEHPVLFATASGGPIALLYAATRPQRTRGLILANTQAAIAWADDYPAGVTPDEYERFVEYVERVWGSGRFIAGQLSDVVVDDVLLKDFARAERLAMAPSVVGAITRQQYATDVRAILPVISAPTLVLHTVDNRRCPIEYGRYLAQHITNARLVELRGADYAVTLGKTGEFVADEIEEFLTGARTVSGGDRNLATLLFSDIAGSTERVATIGDSAWRSVLDRHDDVARRMLRRYGGHAEKFMGDGLLATFDGPARAIRCATAIRDAARRIGLDLRVGIHTGEVERRGSELAGLAVHLAHRVCEAAGPGEVLVSRTVVDLVAGSGTTFEDRGEHRLKGVPGSWRLYAAIA